MSEKKTKEAETTKVEPTKKRFDGAKEMFVRVIIALVLLSVFGSIAFSTVTIWNGTTELYNKVLIAPAAIFDVVIAFVAFSKITK